MMYAHVIIMPPSERGGTDIQRLIFLCFHVSESFWMINHDQFKVVLIYQTCQCISSRPWLGLVISELDFLRSHDALTYFLMSNYTCLYYIKLRTQIFDNLVTSKLFQVGNEGESFILQSLIAFQLVRDFCYKMYCNNLKLCLVNTHLKKTWKTLYIILSIDI